MKRLILGAAAACLALLGAAPALASVPAPATSSVASLQAASGCRFNYLFTWHNANPGYLGLTRTNVRSIVSVGGVNCSRAQDRAIMVCEYVGPRAAHVNRTYTGRIVRLGISQVNCTRFSIAPGWTLLTGRAGGLQYRNSPSLPWSTHFVVS